MPAGKVNPPKEKLPPLARMLVRYILGFGVSVAVGLAPYIGRLNVPLFTPLLSMMPVSLQDTAIPLSATLMGVVAVAIQWHGRDRLNRKWIEKSFKTTLALALLCLIVLVVVHPFAVATVKVGPERERMSFVVGVIDSDKPQCPDDPEEGRETDCNPCPQGMSPEECIGRIGTSEGAIKSQWGARQIAVMSLLLLLPYLGFMTSFGLMVGLLLLEETRVRGAQRTRKPRPVKAPLKGDQR
jgi:hypothetical protein